MALHRLTPTQYACVLPLFDEQTTPPLYCQGILAGKYPGGVLVDEVDQPQSAVVIKELWWHVLGHPNTSSFNEALRLGLAEKQLIGPQTGAIFFVDPPAAWGGVLNGLIQNRPLIETPRYLYQATEDFQAPAPGLPPGYTLHFIDDSIRTLVEGDLPEDVQKILNLRRDTAVPDEMGLGYVALHDRACVAWSVIDFIVGQVGEIRLVTDGGHRRRGLAFTTSAATITYGLAHGLQQINWDVAASNLGSIRTAEKLGLRRVREGKEYVLIFPEVGYLINLAWSHLDGHRFEQTQAVTETMINSGQATLIQYGQFLTGAAWAGLGNPDQALAHIHQALDAGFNDWPELENCPQLTSLYAWPAWEQVVARVEKLKNH